MAHDIYIVEHGIDHLVQAAEEPEDNSAYFAKITLKFVRDAGFADAITDRGTIKVYHGTSKSNRDAILRQGTFKGFPWFALRRETSEGYAKRHGWRNPVVLELEVDPSAVLPCGGDDYLSARMEGLTIHGWSAGNHIWHLPESSSLVAVAAYDYADDTEYDTGYQGLVRALLRLGQPRMRGDGLIVTYKGVDIEVVPIVSKKLVKKHREAKRREYKDIEKYTVYVNHRSASNVRRESIVRVLDDIRKEIDTDTLRATASDEAAHIALVDGTYKPTTNSEGHPIAHSDAGLVNFWRWFGDSKVVDDHGRPTVAFHGVGKLGKFNEFNRSLLGSTSGNRGHFGTGFYFAWSADDAKLFSEAYGGTGEVLACYLKIDKPFKPTNDSLWELGQKHKNLDVPDKEASHIDGKDLSHQLHVKYPKLARVFDVLLEKGQSEGWKELLADNDDKLPEAEHDLNTVNDAVKYSTPDRMRGVPEWIVEDLKEIGLDPHLVYDHHHDLHMEYLTETGMHADEWAAAMRHEGFDGVIGSELVVFEPGQIKSATENNGEFSPETNTITAATVRPSTLMAAPRPMKAPVEMIRLDKVKGLTADSANRARSVLQTLCKGAPLSELQNPGVLLDNGTRMPVTLSNMPNHGAYKNIWYMRYEDQAARKHWRFYYILGKTHVGLLDIFDKDGNSIDKEQMNRLTILARRFRAQTGDG